MTGLYNCLKSRLQIMDSHFLINQKRLLTLTRKYIVRGQLIGQMFPLQSVHIQRLPKRAYHITRATDENIEATYESFLPAREACEWSMWYLRSF